MSCLEISANQPPVNIFTAGSFESGIKDIEIYRYPKFYEDDRDFVPVSHETRKPINGIGSLLLPSINKGGYKLIPHVFMLESHQEYPFSMLLKSSEPVSVRVEVLQKKKRLAVQKYKTQKGMTRIDFNFRTGQTSESHKRVPVRLNIWLSSKGNVTIDDITIMGKEPVSEFTKQVSILTNSATSVFDINELATAQVIRTVNNGSDFYYKIRDIITSKITSSGALDKENKLQLDTSRRGAYWIEIWSGNTEKNAEFVERRSYVVINKDAGSVADRDKFGIAMEEHGQRTMIDARLQGGELYKLASEVGAGNVRLFTPAMPDLLSNNGQKYDFSFLNHSLDAASQYNLIPMLELGSNLPNRIPSWLRTSEKSSKTVELRDGLRSKKLKQNFAKSKGGNYLDLGVYESYLKALFNHINGRVQYYEIWNEPGHKFTPETYNRIAQVTRRVQRELQPEAKLLGFTSTKGKGLDVALEESPLPRFLQKMISIGAASNIDILSFHSHHAFRFLGKKFDFRNEETGYPDLIRKVLDEADLSDAFDIWDTERGISWTSSHPGRADQISGDTKVNALNKTHDFLEVSRRLPVIHAAAFASGVKKVFWFYMDSSTSTIIKLHHRYGFFDAELEPMPQIAVYDAMTEILGDAKFERLIDLNSGTRIYLFSRGEKVIALIYNWKQMNDEISYISTQHHVSHLNIMGNPVEQNKQVKNASKVSVAVDGWPKYLLFDKTDANSIKFE